MPPSAKATPNVPGDFHVTYIPSQFPLPLPADLFLLTTGKMAQWLNTCHVGVRNGVQMPRTHMNATWEWWPACNSSLRR